MGIQAISPGDPQMLCSQRSFGAELLRSGSATTVVTHLDLPWELLSQNWPWPNIYVCTHKACSCYCQTRSTHGSTSNLLTCPAGTEFAKLPTGIDPHNCWDTQILALLPSHTAPGHLLGFQPHLCTWPTNWCLHAPRTPRGGAVPTVSTSRMRLLWQAPPLTWSMKVNNGASVVDPGSFLCTPPLPPGPHSSPLSLSLHSQPQSPLQTCPPKPKPQCPAPAHTSRHASRAGDCSTIASTPYAGLYVPPAQTGCCNLLQAPSVLADLPASEGASQGKGTPSFHSSLPRVQVPSQIPPLFFSVPPGHLAILPTTLVLWAPLPAAFSRYSVRVVPRVDVFWLLFVGTGELHFLLLHSLDLAKRFSL